MHCPILPSGTPLVLPPEHAEATGKTVDKATRERLAERRKREREAAKKEAEQNGVWFTWVAEMLPAGCGWGARIWASTARLLEALREDRPAEAALLDSSGNIPAWGAEEPQEGSKDLRPLSVWPSMVARMVEMYGIPGAILRFTVAWWLAMLGETAHADRYLRCNVSGLVMKGSGPEPEYRLNPITCKSRLCPACTRTRNRVLASNMAQCVQAMKHAHMITVTLRHRRRDQLAPMIDRLNVCFERLRKTDWWRNKNIAGWVKIIEIKHGDHGWHPHIHAIVNANAPLSKKEEKEETEALQRLWHFITCDSWVADIRNVYDNENLTQYLTKYLTKSDGSNLAQVQEYAEATRGRRLVSKGGVLLRDFQLMKPIQASEEAESWAPVAHLDELISLAMQGDPVSQHVIQQIYSRRGWDVERAISRRAEGTGRDPGQAARGNGPPRLSHPQSSPALV
jgi:hypothetical protein